jgi:hypothetical protein
MDEVSRPVIAIALILAAVFIPTAWVLLISIYFPIDNLRRPAQTATGQLSKKSSQILH